MTCYETAAMNRRSLEAELVLQHEPGNATF